MNECIQYSILLNLQSDTTYRAPQECFLSPTVALVGPASQPPAVPAVRFVLSRPLQHE